MTSSRKTRQSVEAELRRVQARLARMKRLGWAGWNWQWQRLKDKEQELLHQVKKEA